MKRARRGGKAFGEHTIASCQNKPCKAPAMNLFMFCDWCCVYLCDACVPVVGKQITEAAR